MKKRYLLLGPIISLIVIVGAWSALEMHARASNPTNRSSTDAQVTPTSPVNLYLTGAQVIPTVKVSTSTANCDPKNIPGVGSDPVHGIGGPAIKPHLCSIPTFTEQDVRQYMSKFPTFGGREYHQTSHSYIITRVLFITNQVANDPNGLNADTGQTDPNLIVCYVEIYGDFVFDGGPPQPQGTPRPPTLLHHGQLVFDGITGNEIDVGIMR